MLNTQPQLILFDLDGTLIDTAPDLAFCIDQMMQRLGRPPHGETKIRHWIGNGIQRLVKRALIDNLYGEPPMSDFEQAYPIFLELYTEYNAKKSTVYHGVREGLTCLKNWRYPLACVTNKMSMFTNPLLKFVQLESYFELIIAGDSLPQKKPDPAPLIHAANYFGIPTATALMVGDSNNDVLAARAAGFSIICVSYGYNHGQDISYTQPDAIIDSILELTNILQKP
jgi:phosphoglycolate phosphatase